MESNKFTNLSTVFVFIGSVLFFYRAEIIDATDAEDPFLHLSPAEIAERFSCDDENGDNKPDTYPIHLTFDDGPSATTTPQVLDTLKKYGIKGTFFTQAEKIDPSEPKNNSRIAVLKRASEEGHNIASHSLSHDNHTLLTQEQVSRNIRESRRIERDLIEKTGIKKFSNYFRLPYGQGWLPIDHIESVLMKYQSDNPEASEMSYTMKRFTIMSELKRNGYQHAGWDIDPQDFDSAQQKDPGILFNILSQICRYKGGVILLHDINPNTAKYLDIWIKAILATGHRFAPIEEFEGNRAMDEFRGLDQCVAETNYLVPSEEVSNWDDLLKQFFGDKPPLEPLLNETTSSDSAPGPVDSVSPILVPAHPTKSETEPDNKEEKPKKKRRFFRRNKAKKDSNDDK